MNNCDKEVITLTAKYVSKTHGRVVYFLVLVADKTHEVEVAEVGFEEHIGGNFYIYCNDSCMRFETIKELKANLGRFIPDSLAMIKFLNPL